MLRWPASFFQPAAVLDNDSRLWIQAVFAWASRQDVLRQQIAGAGLVLPIAAHFPGQASTRHGMAELVFANVCRHAGLEGARFRLADPHGLLDSPLPYTAGGVPPESVPIPYDPRLVTESEALIAHFAREIALRIGATASGPAPAHEGNIAHVAELIAVMAGFGVMLANTAFHVRVNQCGACRGPAAERDAALSRDDLVYALALFCRLKGISPADARRHLKPPLRPVFRRALRELDRSPDEWAHIRPESTGALPESPA